MIIVLSINRNTWALVSVFVFYDRIIQESFLIQTF